MAAESTESVSMIVVKRRVFRVIHIDLVIAFESDAKKKGYQQMVCHSNCVYIPISRSVKLANGHAIQSRSTTFVSSRKVSNISDIVHSPSDSRDKEGESTRRVSTLAVSLETDAMDFVKGDDDIDCRVCERGDVGWCANVLSYDRGARCMMNIHTDMWTW